MLAILREQHFVGRTQDHLVLLLAQPCMLIPWSFFKIVLIWTMVKPKFSIKAEVLGRGWVQRQRRRLRQSPPPPRAQLMLFC